MKTKEKLNALKKEVETESKERQKLTDEELEQVNGGVGLLIMLGSIGLISSGGTMNCPYQGCNSIIASRALKNHLVNQHGFSVEDAMSYIYANDPELAAKQWD